MKIVTANGKQGLKMSKSEWEGIGKKAGWMDPISEREAKEKALRHERTRDPVAEDVNQSLNGDDGYKAMRYIRVTFDDGEVLETQINGTKAEIKEYYLTNDFTKSDEKTSNRGIKVEFLD